MSGLSLHEPSRARQDLDTDGGDASSWNDVCEILPREFSASRKMHLRRTMPCKQGGNFEVDLEISLLPKHSLDARALADLLRTCVGERFAYALATSHAKTLITTLSDREGRPLGDVVASFRRARETGAPTGGAGA